MRGLKDKGVEDLNAIKSRAQKLHAMKRIDGMNLKIITDKLDSLESFIVGMTELDADGEEVG